MKIDDSSITLRPAEESDLQLLFDLYASTRLAEVSPLGWSIEQVTAFINQQFWAQHTHYHTHMPDANYDVILKDNQAIGRIYIDRRTIELQLMEITLLPAVRGQGIGTLLIRALMQEASETSLPVRLYVENFNPAYRLYSRLGFNPIGTNGIYTHMEWVSSTQGQHDENG